MNSVSLKKNVLHYSVFKIVAFKTKFKYYLILYFSKYFCLFKLLYVCVNNLINIFSSKNFFSYFSDLSRFHNLKIN